ncbi:MAG: hypothetical protein A3I05_09730 [Deltaproteobacteria bacterium RIFCSPLOWO2_02_FULL_44_10]|nr:MAG: hypothetical protein A3C46_06510 [Deltaproteobacteria bacterium RIFCSPHIGHO2_02_FULL_44_16]OGQ46478.1 MAG: hypothetical protein A3I05_09730 [Deltaproteobacteria bacterium RIFCSPLOWO2_02_FULL_44_10]
MREQLCYLKNLQESVLSLFSLKHQKIEVYEAQRLLALPLDLELEPTISNLKTEKEIHRQCVLSREYQESVNHVMKGLFFSAVVGFSAIRF